MSNVRLELNSVLRRPILRDRVQINSASTIVEAVTRVAH